MRMTAAAPGHKKEKQAGKLRIISFLLALYYIRNRMPAG